jgi:endonuclease/exonuclease/phosphatase (EEP) superfamily protein YafD
VTSGWERWAPVLLVVLAFVVSSPWAFGYLLPQRGSQAIALAGLAGYGVYAVMAIGLLVWALRRWLALAVVGVLLVPQVLTLSPAYVGDGDIPRRSVVVRVMTANLYFGTADLEQVVALVRERKVDVLALEELSPGAVTGLEQAGLRSELPHAINRAEPGAAGTGLWSRRPFTEVDAAPAGFNSCAADIAVGAGTVRVRAFHPVTPLPTAARWRRSFAAMRAQVRDDAGTPTVLLGDFNATVHHRELRRLMGARWRDAAEVAGAGVVRTWSPRRNAPALLDLDHILVDRGMSVGSFVTVPLRGSDHRAVIAEVGLTART